MAIEKVQSLRRSPSKMWRSSTESRRYQNGNILNNPELFYHEDNYFENGTNGNHTEVTEPQIFSFPDPSWKEHTVVIFKSHGPSRSQPNLQNGNGTEHTATIEEKAPPKQTNLYEDWIRNPAGDQPALVDEYMSSLRPQQVGFINKSGAEIYMSAERAQKLGLIPSFEPAQQELTEHSETIFRRVQPKFPSVQRWIPERDDLT